MRSSLTLGRLPSHRPIGSLLLILLAACAGDSLVIPDGTDIPAQLRVISGDGQTGVAGDPIRNPLVVELRNGADRPFPGAIVVFAFVSPSNGAEIAPPNVETNDSGRASVSVKLGRAAGDQPVEARLVDPAGDLRVHFLLTAIPRPTGGGGGPGGGSGDGDDGGGGGGGGGGAGGGGDDGGGDGGGPPDDGGGNGKDKGKDKGNGNGNGGGGNDDEGHGGGDDDEDD